jgi:hypothetical protein
MTDAKDSPSHRRRRLLAPVLLTLLLTVLLHLLALHWGQAYLNQGMTDQATPPPIQITLQTPPLPQQPVSLPSATPAKPKPPAKTSKPKARPPVVAVATAPPSEHAITAAPPVAEPNTDTDTAAPAAAPSEEVTPATPPAAATSATPGTHYQLDPPPSAVLDFAVHAFTDNLDWYGSSILTWKTDGSNYSIQGEVYARFLAKITFLTYSSNGDINEFGIAPQRYTEQKRNRAATDTYFNRDNNRVSFSSSATSYPRVGGEQDRASLIWQLAAIGRGDRDKFAAGKVIDLFVAGVRDGEVWRMQVVGQEDIRLRSGQTATWHVVRQPLPGSLDQRLDIWLAPGQQWYPVRLRFTETNGDYLELSLSNLKTL